MNKIFFTPFPELITTRLHLHQLEVDDKSAIFKIRNDKIVNKFIDRRMETTIEEVETFIRTINDGVAEDKWIYWAICFKDNPQLIGTICLWNFSADKTTAEIGYELSPSYHKQGIMSEAIESVIGYCRNGLKLKSIDAYTHKDNSASTKLLAKYNFIIDETRQDDSNPYNLIMKLVLMD